MYHAKVLDRWVAVDNVCAWPNLTLMGDGTVGAFIYNRPSHGKMEGDVELWVSDDGLGPWKRRSVVTNHEPGTVRMNHSAGMAADGTLFALVSGWNLGFPDPIRTNNILARVDVRLSTDNGVRWEKAGSVGPSRLPGSPMKTRLPENK